MLNMSRRNIFKFYWIVTFVFCIAVSLGDEADYFPRIYSLHIRTDIQFRFATTLVTSRVANPANFSQETEFKVILPEEAFISNFSLEIDGVIYPGLVRDRNKAKQQYEEAKEKGETTGLVSQDPRDTRTFSIYITVTPYSKATFNMTYQELLARVKGAYEHKIFIDPGYPVKDLQVKVAILESRDITKLFVPQIRAMDELLTNRIHTNESHLVDIKRFGKRSAFISYSPTIDEQDKDGVSGSLVVQYDIDRGIDAGDVLVVNGYFVHFLSPDVKAYIPKDVVFILDESGSMRGRKMEQVKAAMASILDELKEGDTFNIIRFGPDVTVLNRDGMFIASQKTIHKAKKRINRIYPNGGTDINAAILKGLRFLQTHCPEDSGRSRVILFLTDGDPTTGVRSPIKILGNIQYTNIDKIPIYTLAFGREAYWKLIKNMALQNDGVARIIYEDADAGLQISGFFNDISVTLMNNISVNYLGDSVDEESLTQTEFKKYFEGSELVVAGKLKDSVSKTVNLEVLGNSQIGDLNLTVDKDTNNFHSLETGQLMGVADFKEITEKTWAYLTIKQLINKANSLRNRTSAKDLYKQAKRLSLQYNFVTPMTSLVVADQKVKQQKWKQKTGPRPAPSSLYVKTYSGGRGGGGGYGGGGGGDPHYMIRIKGIEHPICFDVQGNDGDILNLITDPRNNITINTLTISGGIDGMGRRKYYIGEIALQMAHHVMVITPNAVIFDTKVFKWKQERVKHFGGHWFLLSPDGHLCKVTFKFGAVLLIKRHQTKDTGMGYLNVYVQHEDGFSKMTTGLIGQFVNGQKHIHLQKQLINKSGLTEARLQIKEGPTFTHNTRSDVKNKTGNGLDNADSVKHQMHHRITARLIQRGEISEKGKEMCWMVLKPFREALIGSKETFVKTELL